MAKEPKLNSAEIADAVMDELTFAWAVPQNAIDIVVLNGVVTLSGEVSNLQARRQAARLARTVRGVRSVVNRIKVDPIWNRTDGKIRRDVNNALLFDKATESYEIGVRVSNNKVTLTGAVDSWQEKKLAEAVAAGVLGVRAIDNRISVRYKTSRPDNEIKQDVLGRLRWDALVDHGLIGVEVDHGKVELRGTVGSAAEARRAHADAYVAGVREVDSSALKVRAWARERFQREQEPIKSDRAIETAVREAMVYDPRVTSSQVEVESTGGIVTLRGKVPSIKARRAAAMDARNTAGVAMVVNRIKVRASTPTDKQLERRIVSSFAADPYVESFEIAVDVSHGIARLSGTVDSYFEKSRAFDLASRIYGVEAIKNNLAVSNPRAPLTYDPYVYDLYPYDLSWYDYDPPRSLIRDSEIRQEINDELFWSPFVDANQVTVSVDDGVATLTGRVDSWAEMNAAVENAFEGGASLVDNELAVKTDRD